jgi:hypothetical protein
MWSAIERWRRPAFSVLSLKVVMFWADLGTRVMVKWEAMKIWREI